MSKPQFKIRCRVIVMKGGRMLVVKHRPNAPFYALPGGHMESGENPYECIAREIKEELGVELTEPKLKYIYTWKESATNQENVEFFFVVTTSDDFSHFEDKVRTHAFEIVDIKWIDNTCELSILPAWVMKEFGENKFEFEGVKFLKE